MFGPWKFSGAGLRTEMWGCEGKTLVWFLGITELSGETQRSGTHDAPLSRPCGPEHGAVQAPRLKPPAGQPMQCVLSGHPPPPPSHPKAGCCRAPANLQEGLKSSSSPRKPHWAPELGTGLVGGEALGAPSPQRHPPPSGTGCYFSTSEQLQGLQPSFIGLFSFIFN